MLTFKPTFKKIIIKVIDKIEITFYKMLALILKLIVHKPIWVVGERNDTAQENGLYFYNYIKNEHPDENSYYILDKTSPDYNSVMDLGNIIDYNSPMHKILYFATKYYVTAHNHF